LDRHQVSRDFTESEIALMTRGDRAAVTAFTQEFLPRVYGLCYRISRQRELAEEATQETFVRALRSLPQLRSPEHLTAWMLAIAANTVRELAQKRPREASLEEEPAARSAAPPDDARAARKHALERAVASLERDERELFLLHTVEGVSLEDLALECKTSAAAMKSRVHRIRAKVRTNAFAVLRRQGELS
jgi:RNA polymerase sigma-70 factor (ECF subfamily)